MPLRARSGQRSTFKSVTSTPFRRRTGFGVLGGAGETDTDCCLSLPQTFAMTSSVVSRKTTIEGNSYLLYRQCFTARGCRYLLIPTARLGSVPVRIRSTSVSESVRRIQKQKKSQRYLADGVKLFDSFQHKRLVQAVLVRCCRTD
jgi:hypothetical protein